MKVNLMYPEGKKLYCKSVIYNLWKIYFKTYYFMGYLEGILRSICDCGSIALHQGRFLNQGAVTLKLKEFP